MKKILFYSFFLTISILIGCKSKDFAPAPKAQFSYQINDEGEVEFKNLSTNTVKYDYAIDDTHNFTPNFTYKFPKNGSYTVTLTVTNSDGATNSFGDIINISNVSGSAMFFKGLLGNQLDILVTVDGKVAGTINGKVYFDNAPDCGNTNSVTISKLTPGTHTYRYVYGTRVVDGTFTVESGVCSRYKIIN